MSFYSGTGIDAHTAFMNRLSAAGVEMVTKWEVATYSGPALRAEYALGQIRGFVFFRTLLVGKDEESLYWVSRYLRNHPDFRDATFRLRRVKVDVKAGALGLTERQGFEGGTPDRIASIIRESGGDEDGLHWALRGQSQFLGWFPPGDRRKAETIAQAVHIGATSPASEEEVAKLRQTLREAANRLPRKDSR